MTPRSTIARRARIELIRLGATVRQRLGQSALHRLLADGTHQITLRGERFTGRTVKEAIERGRDGQEARK